MPRGFGSYRWAVEAGDRSCFATAADLDAKPWWGVGREPTFAGLRAALGTAPRLRREARLPFVAAPVPTRRGEPVFRAKPRSGLAVCPYLAGEAGRHGGGNPESATPSAPCSAGSIWPPAPWRPVPPAAASGWDLDGRWTGGPVSEPARAALRARAGVVRRWLSGFDRLAAAVAPDWVVTHGEPHLLRTRGGLALVDWDTVALAVPERDLWMLGHGSPDGLAAYSEVTGRTADPDALALHRLGWNLMEIAACVAELRSPHRRNAHREGLMGAGRLPRPEPRAARRRGIRRPLTRRWVGSGPRRERATQQTSATWNGVPPEARPVRRPHRSSPGPRQGASEAQRKPHHPVLTAARRPPHGSAQRMGAGLGRRPTSHRHKGL